MTQQDLTNVLTDLLGDRAGRLAPLIQAALNMFLQNRGGNLRGLVDQLDRAGLGTQVRSWIGSGPNKKVTGAQISKAISADELRQLANEAHCTPKEAADGLAEALPLAIDRLTPKGHVPEPAAVQRMLQQLMSR